MTYDTLFIDTTPGVDPRHALVNFSETSNTRNEVFKPKGLVFGDDWSYAIRLVNSDGYSTINGSTDYIVSIALRSPGGSALAANVTSSYSGSYGWYGNLNLATTPLYNALGSEPRLEPEPFLAVVLNYVGVGSSSVQTVLEKQIPLYFSVMSGSLSPVTMSAYYTKEESDARFISHSVATASFATRALSSSFASVSQNSNFATSSRLTTYITEYSVGTGTQAGYQHDITFLSQTGGESPKAVYYDPNRAITYKPTGGELTVTKVIAAQMTASVGLAGTATNATNVAVTAVATNTEMNPCLVAGSGNQPVGIGSQATKWTYNRSSDVLTVPGGVNATASHVAYLTHSNGELYHDGERLTMGSLRKDPTGFPNRTDTTLTFDAASKTFAITGSNFKVYSAGKEYTKNNQAVGIGSAVAGTTTRIYYNETGMDIAQTTGQWDIDTANVPIATVYWDGVRGIIGDERHGIQMDGKTQEYLHETMGPRYASGYTLTHAGSSPTFSVSAGEFYDDDNEYIDTAAISQSRIIWHSGSVMVSTPLQNRMWMTSSAGTIAYDTLTATASVGGGSLVAYWLYAVNGTDTRFISVMGQRTDNTLANARANNLPQDLSFGTFPLDEAKLLYRIIYNNSGVVQDTTDYRQSQFGGSSYVSTDHGTLSGLADDDHAQYLLLAGRTGGQSVTGPVYVTNLSASSNFVAKPSAATVDGVYIQSQTDAGNGSNQRIYFNEWGAGDLYGFSLLHNGGGSPVLGGYTFSNLPTQNYFHILRHEGSTTGSVLMSFARQNNYVGIGTGIPTTTCQVFGEMSASSVKAVSLTGSLSSTAATITTLTSTTSSNTGILYLGNNVSARTYNDRLFQANKYLYNATQSTVFGGTCYITNDLTTANNTTYGGGFDAQYVLTGSGNSTYATDTIWGIGGNVFHQGSGYAHTLNGARIYCVMTGNSGSCTNLFGVRANAYAAAPAASAPVGSRVLSNLMGFYLENWGVYTNNTCSNAYGLYISPSSTTGQYTGNRLAIYQGGATDANYFAGNITSSNIAPTTTNTSDLGTAAKLWKTAYIHQVSATGLTGSVLFTGKTANRVPVWIGNELSATSSLYANGDNVGIGVSPLNTRKLYIVEDAGTSGTSSAVYATNNITSVGGAQVPISVFGYTGVGGSSINHTGTLIGIKGVGSFDGSIGTGSLIIGGQFEANITNTNAKATACRAIVGSVNSVGAGGSTPLTEATVLYLESITTAGSPTKYAIYQNGSADLNFFNGPVTADGTLTVNGTLDSNANATLTRVTASSLQVTGLTNFANIKAGTVNSGSFVLEGSNVVYPVSFSANFASTNYAVNVTPEFGTVARYFITGKAVNGFRLNENTASATHNAMWSAIAYS
jgi:hypothetical protein